MQPHLRKCFDAIVRLDFALLPKQPSDAAGTMADDGKQEVIYSKDILSMVSPEGEKVRFESVKTLSHHALCIVLSVVLLFRPC